MTSVSICRRIGNLDAKLDIDDGAPHVGSDQIQHLLGHGRELPNAKIRPEHHDGQLHAVQQIGEVIVDEAELEVARVQLLAEGRQLLVARLDLLLGGFQLLVDTLQFLVGRLHLFVGRLELLVGSVLLLDHGVQVFTGGRELLGHAGGLSVTGFFHFGLRLAAVAGCPRGPARIATGHG
jgi:hypothetical protein